MPCLYSTHYLIVEGLMSSAYTYIIYVLYIIIRAMFAIANEIVG